MIKEFLNKEVIIAVINGHIVANPNKYPVRIAPSTYIGVMIAVDDEFVKLNNNTIVAIKYITSIREK